MALLFDSPIKTGKVRKDTYYYMYRNGMIEIKGTRFYLYSITNAIKKWRQDNPIKF